MKRSIWPLKHGKVHLFLVSQHSKTEKKRLSRYCDLFHEAPTHVFIRYGEKGMDQERMVSNLLEVFKEHGVEEEKREYIRKSLTSKSLSGRKTEKTFRKHPTHDEEFSD